MTKYYKVVTEKGGEYWSHMSRLLHSVRYKVGEVTLPYYQGSGLYVFNNFADAAQFLRNEGSASSHIFECEVTNPRPTEICAIGNYAADFWKTASQLDKLTEEAMLTACKQSGPMTVFFRAPEGSCVASSVKLIRQVR